MEIKVLKTPEVPNDLWIKIAEGFNESFELNVTAEGMRNGFCTKNRDGYGYHAIALSDDGEVMGYNVFSPVYYKNGLKTVVSGSTFVRKKYRTNELLFLELVNALRNAVKRDGFEVEVGVPNHNSEKFAIKILKFKYVSELNYYILPFNLSRCLNNPNLSCIDWLVNFGAHFHLLFQSLLSSIIRANERETKYEIEIDDNYWKYRFSGGHYKEYHDGDFRAYWLPYEEEGANVVYLMDFRESNKRTYKSLIKALRVIGQEGNVDVILFVGYLHMFQLGLLRCPKRLVPKRLPLTYCVLNKSDESKYSDMTNKKNWNFSLMNFDVR